MNDNILEVLNGTEGNSSTVLEAFDAFGTSQEKSATLKDSIINSLNSKGTVTIYESNKTIEDFSNEDIIEYNGTNYYKIGTGFDVTTLEVGKIYTENDDLQIVCYEDFDSLFPVYLPNNSELRNFTIQCFEQEGNFVFILINNNNYIGDIIFIITSQGDIYVHQLLLKGRITFDKNKINWESNNPNAFIIPYKEQSFNYVFRYPNDETEYYYGPDIWTGEGDGTDTPADYDSDYFIGWQYASMDENSGSIFFNAIYYNFSDPEDPDPEDPDPEDPVE